MKCFISAGILVVICVLLSACVSGTADITVNQDGSADASVKVGVEQQAKQLLGNADPFTYIRLMLEHKGFRVEEYDEKDSFGIQASQHYRSIRELSEQAAPVTGDNEAGGNDIVSFLYEEEDGFFFTVYDVQGTIHLSELYEDMLQSISGQLSASDMAARFIANELRQRLDLQVKVTLPIQPVESNAAKTENKGKTLQWNIDPVEENVLKLQVKVPNVRNIIIVAAAALVIICIGAYMVMKRRKTKRTDNSAS